MQGEILTSYKLSPNAFELGDLHGKWCPKDATALKWRKESTANGQMVLNKKYGVTNVSFQNPLRAH